MLWPSRQSYTGSPSTPHRPRLESCLLHFQFNLLISRYLRNQQKMIQVLGSGTHMEHPEEVPVSWILPGPTLAIVGIWRVNQGIKDWSISLSPTSLSHLSLCTSIFQTYKINIFKKWLFSVTLTIIIMRTNNLGPVSSGKALVLISHLGSPLI